DHFSTAGFYLRSHFINQYNRTYPTRKIRSVRIGNQQGIRFTESNVPTPLKQLGAEMLSWLQEAEKIILPNGMKAEKKIVQVTKEVSPGLSILIEKEFDPRGPTEIGSTKITMIPA